MRQTELEQELRLFIIAIAHVLRTPLFSSRGYLEGLEQGLAATPEKKARYITVCQEKADALEGLIAALFAYARMEYLEQAPRHKLLEMAALLGRAVESLLSQVEAKGIALQLDGPRERCMLQGDRKLLERAVENLLNNGLRHTPTGGSVRVSWRAAPDRLLFAVSDTGTGISPATCHTYLPRYTAAKPLGIRKPAAQGWGSRSLATYCWRTGRSDTANLVTGGAEFTGSLPYPSEDLATTRSIQTAVRRLANEDW